MRDRITTIIEHWFIQEPALFQILCTHELAENTQMACPIRSGKRRIEYNPDFLLEMTDQGLEEALRTEAVRILLKHPYERKPDGCSQQAIALGSNIVVGDNYKESTFMIDKPSDYELPSGMAYEPERSNPCCLRRTGKTVGERVVRMTGLRKHRPRTRISPSSGKRTN